MKENNPKTIIGRVRSRMNLFIWILIIVGGTIFALWNVFGVLDVEELSKLPIYMGSIQVARAFVMIIVFGILWVAVSTMLFLGSNQFIQIDDKNLSYCEAKGLRGKMKQFINTCFHHQQSFDIQIRISEIKKIRLSFSDNFVWFVLKGHTILYDVEMNDGTMMRILPDNLYLKKENCLLGIEHLEKLRVCIDDPFHIKDALKDKSINLGEYFDRLEKEYES